MKNSMNPHRVATIGAINKRIRADLATLATFKGLNFPSISSDVQARVDSDQQAVRDLGGTPEVAVT